MFLAFSRRKYVTSMNTDQQKDYIIKNTMMHVSRAHYKCKTRELIYKLSSLSITRERFVNTWSQLQIPHILHGVKISPGIYKRTDLFYMGT